MSYQKPTVSHKQSPINLLTKKRSVGRMKSYSSVCDARAWSHNPDERRQYILDIIRGQCENEKLNQALNFGKIDETCNIRRIEKENEQLKRKLRELEQEHQRQAFQDKQTNKEHPIPEVTSDYSSNINVNTKPVVEQVPVATSTNTLEFAEVFSKIELEQFSESYGNFVPVEEVVIPEDPQPDNISAKIQKVLDESRSYVSTENSHNQSPIMSRKSPQPSNTSTPYRDIPPAEEPEEIGIEITNYEMEPSVKSSEKVMNEPNLEPPQFNEPEENSAEPVGKICYCTTTTINKSSHEFPRDDQGDHEYHQELSMKCDKMRKLVELEVKLMIKKKCTKQRVDSLKTMFIRLRKELEIEKHRTKCLFCEARCAGNEVQRLKIQNAQILQQNIKERSKVGQLAMALHKILEENAYLCTLMRKNEETTTTKSDHSFELEKLYSRIKELEDAIQAKDRNLNDQVKLYNNLMEKYEAELDAKNDVLKMLADYKSNFDKELLETRSSLKSLLVKLQRCQRRHSSIKETKQKEAEKISSLEVELSKASSVIEDLKDDHNYLDEENQTLRRNLIEIQEKCRDDLNSCRQEKNNLETRIDELTKNVGDLEKELADKEKYTAELESELRELRLRIAEINSHEFEKVRELEAEIERLKRIIEELSMQAEDRNSEWQNQVKSYEAAIAELEAGKLSAENSYNENIKLLEAQIKILQESNASLELQIEHIEEECKKKMTKLEDENWDLKNQGDILVEENQSLKFEIEKLKAEIDSLKQQSEDYIKNMKLAEDEQRKLVEEFEHFKEYCESEKEAIQSSFVEKICPDTKEEELNQLKGELEEKDNQLRQLLEEYSDFQQAAQNRELTKIPEIPEEIEQTVMELAAQLDVEEKRCADMQADYELRMKQERDMLEQRINELMIRNDQLLKMVPEKDETGPINVPQELTYRLAEEIHPDQVFQSQIPKKTNEVQSIQSVPGNMSEKSSKIPVIHSAPGIIPGQQNSIKSAPGSLAGSLPQFVSSIPRKSSIASVKEQFKELVQDFKQQFKKQSEDKIAKSASLIPVKVQADEKPPEKKIQTVEKPPEKKESMSKPLLPIKTPVPSAEKKESMSKSLLPIKTLVPSAPIKRCSIENKKPSLKEFFRLSPPASISKFGSTNQTRNYVCHCKSMNQKQPYLIQNQRRPLPLPQLQPLPQQQLVVQNHQQSLEPLDTSFPQPCTALVIRGEAIRNDPLICLEKMEKTLILKQEKTKAKLDTLLKNVALFRNQLEVEKKKNMTIVNSKANQSKECSVKKYNNKGQFKSISGPSILTTCKDKEGRPTICKCKPKRTIFP